VRDGQAIVLLRDGAPASAASAMLPEVRQRVFAASGGTTVESALPRHLRDTRVRVDHKLTTNEVRVVPHPPGDGPITGVEVVIGPDARPVDVALHAHEVARMRRWTGRLGQARMALARYAERVGLRLDTPADRARFEAAGELGKLEPIIDERVRRHAEATDPAVAAALELQIQHLLAQQERSRRILSGELPAAPRGYVAAEAPPKATAHETTPAPTDDAAAAATRERAQALTRRLIGFEASVDTWNRRIQEAESPIRQAADSVHDILRKRGPETRALIGDLETFRRRFVEDPGLLESLAPRLGDAKVAELRERIAAARAKADEYRGHLAKLDAAIVKARAEIDALGVPALNAELNLRLTYERLREGLKLICFPPDTPVAVPGGTVPIGSLQPGDAVVSADPESGETRIDRVTRRIDGWTDWLVEIAVGSETLRATRSHRFAVVGGGWVPARLLTPGTRLVSLDGEEQIVERVSLVRDDTPTCNLEVEANHSYFAGGVLVHNGEGARVYDSPNVWEGEIYYLRKNGVVVYVGSTNMEGLTFARFKGHLEDGRTMAMPKKHDWYVQYTAAGRPTLTGDTLTFGDYELKVEHRGNYTDLALAIVEQAHIFANEGHLLNDDPAIGVAAFEKYFTDARRLADAPCR
jgi:hypothetical protein